MRRPRAAQIQKFCARLADGDKVAVPDEGVGYRVPASVCARMRRADRHERVVELDHQPVGEGRRPGLDFAKQPRRAKLDREVVGEFRADARRDPVRRRDVAFIASTNSGSVLRNSISGSRRERQASTIAVSGPAKPAEIAGIAGAAGRLPEASTIRARSSSVTISAPRGPGARPSGSGGRSRERAARRRADDQGPARAPPRPRAQPKATARQARSRDRRPPIRPRTGRDVRDRAP